MSYKEEMVRRYYTSHYNRFNPSNADLWGWVQRRLEYNFGQYVDTLDPEGVVLDLPCGIGYLEHYLLKKQFTTIQAVDLSEEQLEVARNLLASKYDNYQGSVTFIHADALTHLASGNRYSAIFMIDFIEHLTKSEAARVLILAHSALVTGGLLFIRTPNAERPMFGRFYDDFTHETPFTICSLRQLIKIAGLHIEQIDYERTGYILEEVGCYQKCKRSLHRLGQRCLGAVIGLRPEGFSENLICIARK